MRKLLASIALTVLSVLSLSGTATAAAPTPGVRAVGIESIRAADKALPLGMYNCAGRTQGYVLKNFQPHPPLLSFPMRCGTSSWGYLHVQSRYNSVFEGLIQQTITSPTNEYLQGTNTRVFDKRFGCCTVPAAFRVVWDQGKYTLDGRSRGLITAYPID
jgi:hypothetical protein